MRELPEVLGQAELLEMFGISHQALYDRLKRNRFPQPDWKLQCGPIWKGKSLKKWLMTPAGESLRKRLEG